MHWAAKLERVCVTVIMTSEWSRMKLCSCIVHYGAHCQNGSCFVEMWIWACLSYTFDFWQCAKQFVEAESNTRTSEKERKTGINKQINSFVMLLLSLYLHACFSSLFIYVFRFLYLVYSHHCTYLPGVRCFFLLCVCVRHRCFPIGLF